MPFFVPQDYHLISPAAGWPSGQLLVPGVTGTCVRVVAAVLSSPSLLQFQFVDDENTPLSGLFVVQNSLLIPQNINGDWWHTTGLDRGLALSMPSGGVLYGDIYAVQS